MRAKMKLCKMFDGNISWFKARKQTSRLDCSRQVLHLHIRPGIFPIKKSNNSGLWWSPVSETTGSLAWATYNNKSFSQVSPENYFEFEYVQCHYEWIHWPPLKGNTPKLIPWLSLSFCWLNTLLILLIQWNFPRKYLCDKLRNLVITALSLGNGL